MLIFFLFISLTPILIWEHYELTKKNQEHLTWKSCVSSTVLASVQRSPVGGERGTRETHGTWKEVIRWDVSLPLIKAHRAVFYILSHVNYILDLFIGGHLN